MLRFKYSDHFINISLLIISALSIVMTGSASIDQLGKQTAIFNMIKQMAFIVVGFIAMMFMRLIFRTSLINRWVVNGLYVAVFVLMGVCLAFEPINGSQAWIPLGLFSLQPSEFAKLVVMLYIAYYMVDVVGAMRISPYVSYQEKEKQKKFFYSFVWPLLACFILVGVCVFAQNDLGTGVIILGITLVCFFCSNNRYYRRFQKPLFKFFMVAAIVVVIVVLLAPDVLQGYQEARIASWLDPLVDPTGDSFQQVNGLIAFAQGGLWGKGLGKSTQKFGYIPEATNDYISAIIFEELGIFGLALIVVPFVLIIWRLFHHAYRINDGKAKIILCGIGTYFFLHLFLNLGGVSGLIPMTGVPLLCISAGGSSTLAAYMAIGMAQAIIERHNREKAAQSL